MESYRISHASEEERFESYQTNNEACPDIAEIVFSSILISLAETPQEIGHCEKAGDLASIVTKAWFELARLRCRSLSKPRSLHEATHGNEHTHVE